MGELEEIKAAATEASDRLKRLNDLEEKLQGDIYVCIYVCMYGRRGFRQVEETKRFGGKA